MRNEKFIVNMAATLRRGIFCVYRRNLPVRRLFSSQFNGPQLPKTISILGYTSGALLSLYIANKTKHVWFSSAVQAKDISKAKAIIQTQREFRFLSFASVEYEDNVYMTPEDFLESVTEEAPRPRAGRKKLRRDDVVKSIRNTPAKRKASPTLFRDIHNEGLISYTEYLFLLCVLTKPHSGFKIAFNMFDVDGNQRVDKKEFLVLVSMFQMAIGEDSKLVTDLQRSKRPEKQNLWNLISVPTTPLERIITNAQRGLKDRSQGPTLVPDNADGHVTDTTLLVHFFGSKGTDVLKYTDFYSFMDNLQTEVLQLEFNEFSKGMSTISEEEFAKILLRYTVLSPEDHEEYLERLESKIKDRKGISFNEFKEFGQFLNNLDDFSIAMRIYAFGDHPINEDEFKRAVKVCTGQSLNDHLVHVVFQLFDVDGDSNLSHKEFISVMKDRLHRGFRSNLGDNTRWDVFRSCVKNEMKTA